MSILVMFNELEDMIENAPGVPLTDKVLISADRVLELLDQIRTSLPEEIRQAKLVIKEKQRILDDAGEEAERVSKEAKEYIARMADDNEVMHQARAQAELIIKKAEETAHEIRQGADSYADEMLERLQNNLEKATTTIINCREELKRG